MAGWRLVGISTVECCGEFPQYNMGKTGRIEGPRIQEFKWTGEYCLGEVLGSIKGEDWGESKKYV